MKHWVLICFAVCVSVFTARTEDSLAVLTTQMFDASQRISLYDADPWIFREGHNPAWANVNIDNAEWKRMTPSELSAALADDQGRFEGWFRIKLKTDNTLTSVPLGITTGTWAAKDVYLDGRLIATFGNTGSSGMPYHEYNPYHKLPVPIDLRSGVEHVLAIHVEDRISPLSRRQLKSGKNPPRAFLVITGPEFVPISLNLQRQRQIHHTIWIAVGGLLSLLFWLLYYLHRHDKSLLLISVFVTLSTLSSVSTVLSMGAHTSFNSFLILDALWSIFGWMMIGMTGLVMAQIFNHRIPMWLKWFFACITLFGIIDGLWPSEIPKIVAAVVCLVVFVYYLVLSWKKATGAQWAVVLGLLFTLVWLVVWAILRSELIATPTLLSFPVALLVYLAIRFKEINQDERIAANQLVQMAKEKEDLLANQNELLEQQVRDRTSELKLSLGNLQATQQQLIHAEKMASLGELTSGIAHEIQNPLNFVNNFSEVSNELLDELQSELSNNPSRSVNTILQDLKQNLSKISDHGKRADSIVKGMLQHSRSGSGTKELTDINALADECLRLAFHGFRAKDKSFNATTKTDFDPNIKEIQIVKQDISRVILNLLTNAFYACTERSRSAMHEKKENFEPTVTLSTKQNGNMIEVSIKDNGNGIPQNILDKIFQPFFTTKPGGQGTGLGLSLSYEIVTKGHGGEIKVNSIEGEGTDFIISLPK